MSNTKISLTPTQRTILGALAADGGDRFLGYEDIGRLTGRSAAAVKYQINQLKHKGIHLEMITSAKNQARYKMGSRVKHLLNSE